MNFSMVLEEFNGLCNGHFENIVNGSSSPFNLKTLSSVAFPVANIASDPNIGEEIHLEFNRTPSATGFATAAFDVETEMAGFVAAFLG